MHVAKSHVKFRRSQVDVLISRLRSNQHEPQQVVLGRNIQGLRVPGSGFELYRVKGLRVQGSGPYLMRSTPWDIEEFYLTLS